MAELEDVRKAVMWRMNAIVDEVDFTFGHIWFHTKRNKYEICAPHEGNGYSWYFRRARIKGFVSWADSTDEECLFKSLDTLLERIKRI